MVEIIKELCEKKGTTIRGLEKAIGAGGGTISRWDEHSPSITWVISVADYFGVSLDYLTERNIKGKKPLSPNEKMLLEITSGLNDDGFNMVIEIARGIAVQSKYKKRSKMGRDKSENEEFINEA